METKKDKQSFERRTKQSMSYFLILSDSMNAWQSKQYGSDKNRLIDQWKRIKIREFAIWLRKLKPGLCINLEGWDGEGDGREVQKGGIYVYLWLIHAEVWQKTAKFCKAIILQ